MQEELQRRGTTPSIAQYKANRAHTLRGTIAVAAAVRGMHSRRTRSPTGIERAHTTYGAVAGERQSQSQSQIESEFEDKDRL